MNNAPHDDADEAASRLAGVVDDSAARDECTSWACDELAAGRSAEDVAAELVTNGWTTADAEDIAEQARRRTRHHRGVVTRGDVGRAYGAGDPNVTRDAIPFAKPSMFGAVGNLIRAFFRLWVTKDVGRRK